jgi:hypothetical protein
MEEEGTGYNEMMLEYVSPDLSEDSGDRYLICSQQQEDIIFPKQEEPERSQSRQSFNPKHKIAIPLPAEKKLFPPTLPPVRKKVEIY